MNRPRLFIEAPCGSAGVTLSLLAGGRVQPPVAFMGGKFRRWAEQILAAMGLHPGQGADAVLLCDAGPWGWAWRAITDPKVRPAVAANLRAWADEDPRELWDRLVTIPPSPCLLSRSGRPDAAAVARWLWLQGRSLSQAPVFPAADGSGWCICERRAGRKDSPKPAVQRGKWDQGHSAGLQEPGTIARRLDSVASMALPPLSVVHGSAEDLAARGDLAGVYVYMDPPYVGRTGYGFDFARSAVVAKALEFSSAGAVVCVSEGEPVSELCLAGWDTACLNQGARPNAREYVTVNRQIPLRAILGPLFASLDRRQPTGVEL